MIRPKPTAEVDSMGFRLRGKEMTRLETFVDAAFAFVVTLLALSQEEIPASYADLIELMKNTPAFLASFAILTLFWLDNVRFSQRFGLEDKTTVWLSVLLVAILLLYVYPLRFMATVGFAYFIPPLRPPDETWKSAITEPREMSRLFVIYAIGFAAVTGTAALLYLNAVRQRVALGLSDREVYIAKAEAGSSLIYIGLCCVSIVLALTLVGSIWMMTAGFVYALLGVFVPVYWVQVERRWRRTRGEGAG